MLVAGERGGQLAKLVFGGLGVGALWKSLSWIFNVFRTEIGYSTPRTSQFPNATLNIDVSPEYLGVGLRDRPRHRGDDVRWRRLLVARAAAAADDPRRLHQRAVSAHSSQLREQPGDRPAVPHLRDGARAAVERVIRYIGAGAVLASGLITLGRTIPTIISSARESLRDLSAGSGGPRGCEPSATFR